MNGNDKKIFGERKVIKFVLIINITSLSKAEYVECLWDDFSKRGRWIELRSQ